MSLFETCRTWLRGPRPPKLPTAPLSKAAQEAWDVLNGVKRSPAELLKLAKTLKDEEQAFTLARRLLMRAVAAPELDEDPKLRRKILQQCALCTYKDTDLPAYERLETALGLLRRADDLATTTDQETLGLCGAIYKRK